jgi:urea carboxylase system permease
VNARSASRKNLAGRAMGPFSSFAASFSGLSVLTGLFQVWFLGYAFGGPAFVWFWPIVFAGQFTVALVFAEMAARFPFAGAAYQWARHLGGRTWGWVTGWIYLLAQLVTLPAAVVAMQLTLPQLWPGFTITEDFAKNSVILGLGTLAIVTAVNIAGVRLMALVNNIGVAVEIGGALLLIVLLAMHVHHPGIVFETNGTGDGRTWGYLGAFLVSGFMALYNMYAFDAAASMSEETTDPARTAPRAVLRSLLAAGTIGMLILFLSAMAIPDGTAAELGTVGLPYVVTTVLGDGLGLLMIVAVTIAIFVCSLAIQAWTARTALAMGRERDLPAGKWLGSTTQHGVPVHATLAVAGVALVILAVNFNNPKAFNVVVALGIVFIYLAYLSVTVIGLRRRLQGWPYDQPTEGLFTMPRKVGIAVNVVAIAYGAIMLVNLVWPRAEFYGDAWYQQYAVVIFVPLAIAAGLVYYVVAIARTRSVTPTPDPVATETPLEQSGR